MIDQLVPIVQQDTPFVGNPLDGSKPLSLAGKGRQE